MRSSRNYFSPVLLACCFLIVLGTCWASASKPKKPAPPPDLRKLIKSVNTQSSSVVIVYMESKLTHTYRIDAVTVLKVNGIPGKIADIKPGMEVMDYLERDNDDLDGLTLTGYGEEPKTKPKAAKKPAPKPASSSSSSTP